METPMAAERTLQITLTLPEHEMRRLLAYMVWKKHRNTDESISGLVGGAFRYMAAEAVEVDQKLVDAIVTRHWPAPEPKSPAELGN
jgi:hypothetical protein